jgi:hypothetical protein
MQLVVLFSDSNSAQNFAKVFYLVSSLSVLVDWGGASIGARNMNGVGSKRAKLNYSISYETVRLCVLLFSCLFLFIISTLTRHAMPFELTYAVCLGLLSAFLFPNWLNLTRVLTRGFLFKLAAYRFLALLFVLTYSLSSGDDYLLATYYYGLLALGALYFRARFVPPRLWVFLKCQEGTLRVFLKGMVFTGGSFVSYLITGAGSVLLISSFVEGDFVNFVLAERFLAVGRVILGLIFQRSFIRREFKYNSETSKIYHFGYLAFLFSFYLAIFFIDYIFFKSSFFIYFSIMFVGFSLSGFSHVWVTENLLGRERFVAWSLVLIMAIFVYVFTAALMFKFDVGNGSYVASYATMCAEISIFVIGFLFRKKK